MVQQKKIFEKKSKNQGEEKSCHFFNEFVFFFESIVVI